MDQFRKFTGLKVAERLEGEPLTTVACCRPNLRDTKYERHDERKREREIGGRSDDVVRHSTRRLVVSAGDPERRHRVIEIRWPPLRRTRSRVDLDTGKVRVDRAASPPDRLGLEPST